MDLWQQNGGPPAALPFEDTGADGIIYTDLANNPDGLERCGFTPAPDQPAYDPATQMVVWQDGAWSVQPLPPPPPPPRAELPKSTVVQRLGALGKAAAVMTTLQADPLTFALWFSPDWPNVYKDDSQVISLLQASGLTADEISQVLA